MSDAQPKRHHDEETDELVPCDKYCILGDDHYGDCRDEPTDDEIYNGPGMEGGIAYR